MATSAEFLQCQLGGTSTSYICILYSSYIISLRDSDISLSKMCFLGIIPNSRNRNIIARYSFVRSTSLRFCRGLTRIALLSISTMTKMYLFPRCERVGSCPVLSVSYFFRRWCICYVTFILGVLMCWAPRWECV